MTKDDVKKQIQTYSFWKNLIILLLAVSTVVMGISTITMEFCEVEWVMYCGVISYIVMLFLVFVACIFPLNKPLTDFISLSDYKAILEYFIDISESMNEWAYHDGLYLIKRAFTQTVRHPSINGLSDKLREHLFYMEGIVFKNKKSTNIPKELLNRSYAKALCALLLEQINSDQHPRVEIDKSKYEKKESKRYVYISNDFIYKSVTILLIILVIAKIAISLNDDWYLLTSTNVFFRVFYNISADVMAIYFAIHSMKPQK